jgi:hypothetical protein
MSRDEEALERKASDYETAAKLCGMLVVLGILIEAWVALHFSDHKDNWQNLGPVFANLLVAAGVFGEIAFAGRRSKTEERLREISKSQLAAANQRVAEAELATETLRAQFAWRRLSPHQVQALSEFLTEQPKSSLSLQFTMNDPESLIFANAIGQIFALNGWRVGYRPSGFPGQVAFGIRAYLDPRNEIHDDCRIVQLALQKARILYVDLPGPPASMQEDDGAVPYLSAEIYVGPKPMPFT